MLVDIFVGFCVFSLESVQMISHILKKEIKICKYPTKFLNLDAQNKQLYFTLFTFNFLFFFVSFRPDILTQTKKLRQSHLKSLPSLISMNPECL